MQPSTELSCVDDASHHGLHQSKEVIVYQKQYTLSFPLSTQPRVCALSSRIRSDLHCTSWLLFSVDPATRSSLKVMPTAFCPYCCASFIASVVDTDLKGVFGPSKARISMIASVQQLLVRCSPLRFPAAINFSQIARAKTQSQGGAICFPKSALFTKGFTFSSLSTVRRMPPRPQSSAFGSHVAEKKNVQDDQVAPQDLQPPHPSPNDWRNPADPVVSPTNLLVRTALVVASVGLLTAAAIDCLSSDLPTVESRLVNEPGHDCSKSTATPPTIGGITQPSESSGKPSIVRKLFSFAGYAAIGTVVLGGLFIFGALSAAFLFKGGV